MQMRPRPVALAGTLCACAAQLSQSEAPGLPSALREANRCTADYECFDAGPYCPTECHVPLQDALEIVEPFVVLHESRQAMASGACQMDCSVPFYGFVCRSGQCLKRKVAPDNPICWRARAAVDCLLLLDQHGLWDRCGDFCDGRSVDGTRVQGRIQREVPGGLHVSDGYAIDFFPCSLCPENEANRGTSRPGTKSSETRSR